MIKQFPSNQKIPISEIGRSFVIKAISDEDFRNTIVGKIIFSESKGEYSQEYIWHKNEDIPIDIEEKIKNGHFKFVPEFVEFRPDQGGGKIAIEI
ncbi:MAG: hypothetical protein HC831_25505 [Chloroflexia bacterium]|nr:hypothetical protein [Chloroflexia bacterium]